jgi:nucleotide-binding universal stress UspA family protein
MNTILIALDFSKFSAEVEKRGYELAHRLQTSVILVSVTARHPEYVRPDTGEVFIDRQEERQQLVMESLEKIKQAHPETPTTTIGFIGDPKTGIVEAAIRQNPAFIVVGTHGRTGLSHLLLGSVAEYVIRHSPVPVLVIPYRTERH